MAGGQPRTSSRDPRLIEGPCDEALDEAGRERWIRLDGHAKADEAMGERKNALRWTRMSCRTPRGNAVRLQPLALAHDLANFLRSLVSPEQVARSSLTTSRERLVQIGARIVRHDRYLVSQLAEVAVPRAVPAAILRRIDRLPEPPVAPA